MEENTIQQQPEQQHQQQTKCPGNCSVCNMYQRNYCASQISYTNMKLLTALVNEVNILGDEVKALKAKIDTTQNNTENLIDPTSEE